MSVLRYLCTCLLLALLLGCETAPETGRSQLILFDESEDRALGLEAFRKILSEVEISRDPVLNRRVRRVGMRIARVTPHPDWDWEFVVVEDEDPNAWALPGGKVGVHTGLFKVARNDAQLAAVLGHEIAHAIARHGVERMSQQLLVGLGVLAVGAATEDEDAMQAAALGSLLLISLPFSRAQESEADHIGLLYMARAGYDPRQAIRLWRNFEKVEKGGKVEFLSTHPSHGSRIRRLERLMPQALAEYRRALRRMRSGS